MSGQPGKRILDLLGGTRIRAAATAPRDVMQMIHRAILPKAGGGAAELSNLEVDLEMQSVDTPEVLSMLPTSLVQVSTMLFHNAVFKRWFPSRSL